MLLLQEFDIQIKDKKGSENIVADHLSRLEFEQDEDEEQCNEWFQRVLGVICVRSGKNECRCLFICSVTTDGKLIMTLY